MDNVDSVSVGHSHLSNTFLRFIIIVLPSAGKGIKSSRLLSATISANTVVSASRFIVLVLVMVRAMCDMRWWCRW